MPELIANDPSPPTNDQLANVLAARLPTKLNPSGLLDTSGIYSELPRKIVGRRSEDGQEFGCLWPVDMAFDGEEYESQSAYCKSE